MDRGALPEGPGAPGGGAATRRVGRRRARARCRRARRGRRARGNWMVVERLEGETIPRRILRDEEWATARRALTGQAGRALAAIHTIDPASLEGLPAVDPLGDPLPLLDALGEVRPALELGLRWLAAHHPADGPRVTVHGDYRFGQLPGRSGRAARRPRLGAGAHRRPRRGHRLAVRAGLALRRRGRGRRVRRVARTAVRLPRRRRRGRRRPNACTGGRCTPR